MTRPAISDDQFTQFWEDGYLVLKGFFTTEEIELLAQTARQDRSLDEHAIERADASGGTSRLALWNHPGDDLYGMFSRNEAIVGMVGQLFDDEPYHYHSKMMMKEPRVGGAWEWHQDYGYWYQNGVLSPDMCSVMIAVDPATRENGCLQVLRGSHKIGRIDHFRDGDQAGADKARVAVARERFERVYCELSPGDAIVFHSNTLHASDANLSDDPRWCMICAYNMRNNNPFVESQHPSYSPIDVVPRSAILDFPTQAAEKSVDKQWLDPNKTPTASSLSPDS